MIGIQKIEVTLLEPTGDRCDAIVHVVGPGDSDKTFPLSVTRTVQRIWNLSGATISSGIQELASGIMEIQGTAGVPPEKGYWFDSYNSESDIFATLNKIRNLGIAPFLKDRTVSDEIAAIFGGVTLVEIDRINESFIECTGMRLVKPLDYAFEASEASQDLSSPPANKAEFLYRICILSVIIDSFGVRLPDEESGTGSLKALKKYLSSKFDPGRAQQMTQAFARVKDLRKQYPIHEHYVTGIDGQKIVREEVRAAETFFNFQEHHDYSAKWKKVIDAFLAAMRDLEASLDT